MDLANLKTRQNTGLNRFELEVEGELAVIDYKEGKSGSIYLIHTEVPDRFEGRGVGHKLVREALDLLEHKGVKIIPLCPFVRSYLRSNHGQYDHMFAKGVKL